MSIEDTFEWNNYILFKKAIGKGSYSKVYRGYNKETKQDIALKKILFSKLHNHVKDKVISEINILQKMNHKNIMKMYEYKFEGDYIVLITEYCNENDLGMWLKNKHNVVEIEDIIQQIVCGIMYMHSNNILHRDLKPENILLHNNIIKICDFGFSTIIKDSNMMCNTICGTPLFMSPELLFMKPYTIKSEIWALGILFYMLIYNIHPFGKLINLDDYRMKVKNIIHFPNVMGLDNIINIIKKMLQFNMEERPDIISINKMLNLIPVENLEYNDIIMEPIIEPIMEIIQDNNISKINELEEEIFRLESIIKEKENSSFYCCFNGDDTESDVTGRGRTNKGYEKMSIDKDYFTPPDNFSMPITIPNRNSPLKEKHSFSPGSSGKSKGFLSSSIDKITSFFSPKK